MKKGLHRDGLNLYTTIFDIDLGSDVFNTLETAISDLYKDDLSKFAEISNYSQLIQKSHYPSYQIYSEAMHVDTILAVYKKGNNVIFGQALPGISNATPGSSIASAVWDFNPTHDLRLLAQPENYHYSLLALNYEGHKIRKLLAPLEDNKVHYIYNNTHLSFPFLIKVVNPDINITKLREQAGDPQIQEIINPSTVEIKSDTSIDDHVLNFISKLPIEKFIQTDEYFTKSLKVRDMYLTSEAFTANINAKHTSISSADVFTKYIKLPKEVSKRAALLEYLLYVFNNDVGIITEVIEYNNQRRVIISALRGFIRLELDNNTAYGEAVTTLVDVDDYDYKYADVGRLVQYRGFTRQENEKLGPFIISDLELDLTQMTEDKAKQVIRKIGASVVNYQRYTQSVVSVTSLLNAAILEAKQELQRQQKNEMSKIVKTKISAKFSDLSTAGKPVKFNDMSFEVNKITYGGQVIAITSASADLYIRNTQINPTSWVPDLLGQLIKRASDIEEVDFDRIFQDFLAAIKTSLIEAPATAGKTYELGIKIGDVNAVLTKEIRTQNRTGRYSFSTGTTSRKETTFGLFRINGKRINKDELDTCLERALCYGTTREYNSFLDSVSKCSLRIHNRLEQGIDLEMTNEINYASPIKLKFPMRRINGKNYIKVEDELYGIKDINRLLTLENSVRPFSVLYNSFINNDKILSRPVQEASLLKFFKTGILTYKKQIQAAHKLLAETEQLFNLNAEKIELYNGKIINKGYIVKGTLSTYAVDAENGYNVYHYPTGRNICMVDKSSLTQTGIDKLIGRLYALKNDSIVAKQIDTIGEVVGANNPQVSVNVAGVSVNVAEIEEIV